MGRTDRDEQPHLPLRGEPSRGARARGRGHRSRRHGADRSRVVRWRGPGPRGGAGTPRRRWIPPRAWRARPAVARSGGPEAGGGAGGRRRGSPFPRGIAGCRCGSAAGRDRPLRERPDLVGGPVPAAHPHAAPRKGRDARPALHAYRCTARTPRLAPGRSRRTGGADPPGAPRARVPRRHGTALQRACGTPLRRHAADRRHRVHPLRRARRSSGPRARRSGRGLRRHPHARRVAAPAPRCPRLHTAGRPDRPRGAPRGPSRRPPAASTRGDPRALRRSSRRHRDGVADPRSRVRVLARRTALRVSRRGRPPRRDADRAPPPARVARRARTLSGRGAARRRPPARSRVRHHRRPRLRALLPHRPRHRRVRARARHPLPGARGRRQQRRVLRARRDGGRSRAHRCPLRALRQPRAKRATRHRHRLRARASRGGAPVRLPQVRTRACGPRLRGDQLPRTERGAGGRQGAGLLAGCRLAARRVGRPLEWRRSRRSRRRRRRARIRGAGGGRGGRRGNRRGKPNGKPNGKPKAKPSAAMPRGCRVVFIRVRGRRRPRAFPTGGRRPSG